MTPADAFRRPIGRVTAPVTLVGPAVTSIRRRIDGGYIVDEWGLDVGVQGAMTSVAGLRWSVSIGGADHVPAAGPVLLVANQRLASLSHLAALLALGRELGRPVRFTGMPDVAPLATLLGRVGGIGGRPEDVGGLLRAGEVALVWCGVRVRGGGRVGRLPPDLASPALEAAAPVVPVAIHGNRFGRLLRVEVGEAVEVRRTKGPLAAVELAEAAREAVQTLLDEARPLRWPY
jgi:hypothetical protein